jgi:DNA-binding PadR family transcriptional regulator
VVYRPLISDTMYTDPLPKPLLPSEFYILLALARGDSYPGEISSAVYSDSKGSVIIDASNLRRHMSKLEREAYIEPTGQFPTPRSSVPRTHYAITHHGILRLKEEFIRLTHAVGIGEHAKLTPDPEHPELPIDIQRLMLDT